MVKVTSLLIEAESALGFGFGVRVRTEMKIWCIKGMHLHKVVSSVKKLGLICQVFLKHRIILFL